MAESTIQETDGKPAVSVIIVSDYAGGTEQAWNGFRATLSALARQDFQEPVEYLMGESNAVRDRIPPDLAGIVSSLRVVLCPGSVSYSFKNEAVRAASAELIALVDADCVPESDWLRLMVEALRTHPEAVAVSGKTVYASDRLSVRLLTLLSRSFLDPGQLGTTRFISPNNAAFRRSVYLEHPLPDDLGPFTVRLQSESIWRSGRIMLFEPRARMTHDFEGWKMELDIRKNVGYGTVMTRCRSRILPYAGLVRLGLLAVPLIVAGKTLNSWQDCFRRGPDYRVRWYELPLAVIFAVLVNLMEIPGMIAAFRGQRVTGTHFR